MRENKWTVKTRREKVSKRQPGKQFTETISGIVHEILVRLMLKRFKGKEGKRRVEEKGKAGAI